MKKLISIVTPCYNEEENVEEIYRQIKDIFNRLEKYDYEHIFIDNSSEDKTVSILKDLAKKDHNVKIIVNTRNFGDIRSIFYGLCQARGDGVVFIAADMQDPPAMIPEFIRKWEEGFPVVKGIKTSSEENHFIYKLRSCYYRFANKLSDVELDTHFNGFGLYDKKVVAIFREMPDTYPYLRGLIAELGFESAKIEYRQAERKRGRSKYRNVYKLYDYAMIGITSHSRVPLKIATIAGFFMASLSFLIAVGYLIAKLLFWPMFPMGMAPLIIAVFFLFSVQLFFIGILGEYIGLMHIRSLKRPMVVEKERINFD
ncbi:MAG: glycosyltransferase family 2 protein [Candidatus Omnitrophica bacterium]|nr:glycosyltransferase family 2 protein [Candidatus Omnitrophota bacterium]